MLETERMVKLRIIAPQLLKREVVGYLHRKGCMDIRKSAAKIEDDTPDSVRTALNNQLITMAAAMEVMEKHPVTYGRHMDSTVLLQELQSFHEPEELFTLADMRRLLEEELVDLEQLEKVAGYFEGIDIRFGELKSERLGLRAYLIDNGEREKFNAALKTAKIRNDVVSKQIDKKSSLLLVAYDKKARLEDITSKFKVFEIDLNAKGLTGSPEEVKATIAARRAEIEKELKHIPSRIKEISASSYSRTANYKHSIEVELERAAIAGMFKKTDHLFVVEGWIPLKERDAVFHGIAALTGGKSLVEELQTDELAPTKLSGKGFFAPFEYILEMFSSPRSDEINPTAMYMICFPIFYGLMVSDVGYGVLSFIVSSLLMKKSDPKGLLHNTAGIWRISSLSVMVFGFLTNQWFGLQLNQYFTTFVGFDWTKNISYFLLATIIFGIIQVTLGLVLGFINKYKHGHRLVAYGRLTSIVTLLAGVVAIGGAFFGAVNGSTTMIAGIVAIIGLIATVVLSGIEAVEVTNLIAHPLSYARILGFGFASVIIAMLIDIGFTPNPSQGIPIFLLFSVIFIVLHFFNMILSIFEGIVQGLRLNFIEFFTKFYMGNGVKFKPFAYEEKEGTVVAGKRGGKGKS